jgi:hypothetical protein
VEQIIPKLRKVENTTMTGWGQLQTPTPPWFLILETSSGNAYEWAWRVAAGGAMVRVLRGHKMRTTEALFNELGAALQLPSYFGENWPGLDECLADLSWMPALPRVLLFVQAVEILADEKSELLDLFSDVLVRAAEGWAEPLDRDLAWDRPALPFHAVLQVTAEDRPTVASTWTRSGAAIAELSI